MIAHAFNLLDWMVLAVYGASLLGIGYHFARRQRTTAEYFTGNRRTNPFLAGISIFTASTSIISYIGTPGEYVQYGPALVIFAPLVALPFVYLSVGWILIPGIMRLPITSAYELLEARLGRSVRKAGSSAFIITRLVWMSLILYTSSSVLVNVIGCDPHWSYLITALTGGVTTTYTLYGGIRTVIITEVVQFFLLVLGAFLTLGSISAKLGGITAWWPKHWEAYWPSQPFFSSDPHVRASLVATFISTLIVYFCATMSDQATVQRFLATRDAPAARRPYLMNTVANASVSLILGLVGAALLRFYGVHPEAIPGRLTLARNGDAFFPLYISHFLPTGISGLLVACLLAAAMSCLSAGINATITVISKDFIETASSNRGRNETDQLRLARLLSLGLGLAVIAGSVVIGSVRGNLFEITQKTVQLLAGPLFGLFFLAMFVRYSTPFGAIFGAVYSTAAAVIVGYWDILPGPPGLSFLWITPVSFVVTMAAGLCFSRMPTRGRSPAALTLYALAASVPLAGAIGWIMIIRR